MRQVSRDSQCLLAGDSKTDSFCHREDALRSYLLQVRQETAQRLCDRVYPIEPETQPDGTPTPANRAGQRQLKPSKWWMAFQKRK